MNESGWHDGRGQAVIEALPPSGDQLAPTAGEPPASPGAATADKPRSDAELIELARGWLEDLPWGDADEIDFAALTPDRIRSKVARHYDGGWAGLAADFAL